MRTTQLLVCIAISLLAPSVLAQSNICADLRSLHAKYGSEILAYFNSSGQECVIPPPKAATTSAGDPIWVRQGMGDYRESVDLQLDPGIYRLNLNQPDNARSLAGYRILFVDAIYVPESCFGWTGAIGFPAQTEVEEDCRVIATLDVRARREDHWEVSLSNFTPTLDDTSGAVGWWRAGQGSHHEIVDVSFQPGIYRFNIDKPAPGNWGDIELRHGLDSPPDCFSPHWFEELPFQKRLESECRLYAWLVVDLDIEHEDTDWGISITKLD